MNVKSNVDMTHWSHPLLPERQINKNKPKQLKN